MNTATTSSTHSFPMSRVVRLGRYLCLIALFGALLALPADPLAAEETKRERDEPHWITRYFPKDVLAYVECSDISKSIKRGKELSIVKLFSSKPVMDFFFEIVKKGKGGAQKDLDNFSRFIQVMDPVWKFLEYGFTGEFHLCVPDGTDKLGRGKVLMAGKVREGKKEFVSDFMEYLPEMILFISRALAMEKPFLPYAMKDKLHSFDVTYIKRHRDVDEAESICYLQLESYLVLTVGREAMSDFLLAYLSKPPESLFSNEDLRKCYKEVKKREMFWYVNASRAFERAKNLFEETGVEMPTAFRAMLFMGLESCAGGLSFRGSSVFDEIVSFFNTEREVKNLAFVQGTNCPLSATSLMPDDAYVYFSLPFRLTRMYDATMEDKPELLEPLEEVEERLGVSIRDDVLPMFSQEMEFYFTMSGFLPEMMASMRIIKDPEDVKLFLQVLSMLYPDTIVESRIGEHKIYLLTLTGTARFLFAQAFAVYDDKLLFGSISAINNALMELEGKLSELENFKRFKGRLVRSDTNGFFYLDMERLLLLLKNYLFTFIQKSLGNVNPALLPPDSTIIGNVTPFAGAFSVDGKKLKISTSGFFNLSTFFSLAAMRLTMRNVKAVEAVARKKRDLIRRRRQQQRAKREAEEE